MPGVVPRLRSECLILASVWMYILGMLVPDLTPCRRSHQEILMLSVAGE